MRLSRPMAQRVGRRRHPHAVAALAVGFVTVLSGCTTSADNSATDNYVSGDGVVTTIARADRQPVPSLSGERLGGGTVSLDQFSGRVTVLNVWGSWCGPCRAEADDLVDVASREPDVAFLGINFNDNVAEAQAFAKSQRITYPSLVTKDGSALLAFYGLLTLQSVPSTMVIDEAGGIAALVTGAVDSTTLAGLINDVQAE